MARKTLHDRLVDALVAKGARVVEIDGATHNTVLTRYDGQPGFFFVSPSGALKIGYSAAMSESIPVVRSQLLLQMEGRSAAAPS